MADPAKRRATYQDVLNAPPDMVAEIVGGELRLSPRPGQAHASVHSDLLGLLSPPFRFGNGGPGGWKILLEPELHLAEEILVPDLAGWRRERLPAITEEAFWTITPDWVCEVLSRSTAVHDRYEKLPIYARAGVSFAWLIDAKERALEVFALKDGKWIMADVHRGNVRAHAPPFEAYELDLALLWEDLAPPRGRAPEQGAEYHVAAK